MQRALDILLSTLALIVLLPLFLAVIIILKLTGEHEVFFVQPRIGRGRKLFGAYKFVTMRKNSQHSGTGTVTIKDDPRVLPLGRILRKTKINELPQLLNVLLGDMSVVGPRPLTQRCFDAFSADVQSEIIKVRPGLSGFGAILFRGEEELLGGRDDPMEFYDKVIAPYKGEVEKWYIRNQTVMNYFWVIILTLGVILFPQNRVIWKIFPGIPKPPKELAGM